jgi:PAS domain S-box-containing protein
MAEGARSASLAADNDQEEGATTPSNQMDFLSGGGAMGALMRAKEWSQTPIGPIERWPQSLRTTVSICLASRFPMLIWWSPELVMLYNDAYRPILGATKHPTALGQVGQACWPEIWDIIGPMLHSVLTTGEATWSDDQLLLLDRNGYVEECYFTFSYSPIRGETGGVSGVFTAVTETTERVLRERRMRALRELAATTADAATPADACQRMALTLATAHADLPFALLYLLDAQGTMATLAGSCGLLGETAVAPTPDHQTGMGDQIAGGPLSEAAARGVLIPISRVAALCGATVADLLPTEVRSAYLMPIAQPGQTPAQGVLVVGINPCRAFDEGYQEYCAMLASQTAAALTNARAREEERARAEALAELDRAKTAFFSNVSHEFRTPLTLLLGPIEELLGAREVDALPPAQRERLGIAWRNALRLQKLVNTLLDFSRIEAGRLAATYEPTDLSALTGELASTFRSAIERAGMRLVVDCPTLSQPAYVDLEMWEKIVLNLLSNAYKFTFEGEISVVLREAAGAVELTVRDTGVGIPPEELPHIFERFHTVRGTRARTHEGTGIGLALVRELARRHSGEVRVTSAPDQGSVFTVTMPLGSAHLPADHIGAARAHDATHTGSAPYTEEARRWLDHAPGAASALRAALAQVGAPALANARILLVDDNADMRDYVARLLTEQSWQVTAVGDGAAALASARTSPPDLVLSDVMMPGLDGFALLRALRRDPHTRAVPTILLSARAGEEATIEGLEAGADDYLIKPFSARELIARVRAHLALAQIEREAAERASQLEAVIEAMSDGVFVYDSDGTIVHTNSALREMLGLDANYFAQPMAERIRLLDMRDAQGQPMPREEWVLPRALRGETLRGARAAEQHVRTLDGRDLVLSTTGGPVRDLAGEIVGAVAVVRDVTERRRLDRRTHTALNALLAMASAVVETPDETPTDDAKLAARTQLAATRIADLTREVLGYQRVTITAFDPENGQVRPVAISGVNEEEERAWHVQLAQADLANYLDPRDIAALMAGQVITADLTPSRRKEAAFGGLIAALAPMRLGHRLIGTVAGDFGPGPHDFAPEELAVTGGVAKLAALILERDRLWRERACAEARTLGLKESNRQMSEFLGIAGHELRTPLTVIKANIQLLTKRAQREAASTGDASQVRANTLLPRTERQIDRLSRLVSDLVDVSRIQKGKLDLQPEPCDLVAILRDTLEEQRMTNAERTIRLRLPRDQHAPVMADCDRISQVITNFITNALKYSSADQPVQVGLTLGMDSAQVSVRDHGPGIPPAEREHVWELFHRVRGIEVRSGSGVGLGLGLYICATIVARHGGKVGVESAVGEGSTFWFTLPLRKATAE